MIFAHECLKIGGGEDIQAVIGSNARMLRVRLNERKEQNRVRFFLGSPLISTSFMKMFSGAVSRMSTGLVGRFAAGLFPHYARLAHL